MSSKIETAADALMQPAPQATGVALMNMAAWGMDLDSATKVIAFGSACLFFMIQAVNLYRGVMAARRERREAR